MVIEHGAQRRHQSRVVLHGLAHAHHHHIGDHAIFFVQVLAQKVLGKPQLRQNFACCQIAAKALVPGRAKTAAHRATSLR